MDGKVQGGGQGGDKSQPGSRTLRIRLCLVRCGGAKSKGLVLSHHPVGSGWLATLITNGSDLFVPEPDSHSELGLQASRWHPQLVGPMGTLQVNCTPVYGSPG